MVAVRHRRRLTVVRVLAVVTPVLAVVCAAVAFLVGGAWPLIAAGVGTAASVALGVVVVRLERRLRVQVAAVRAEQAAEYSETHARYAEEHREFTSHMVGLLDTASERLESVRSHVNKLEFDVAYSRSTRPSASTPSTQLARWAEGAEWNDLWPDLSDAPTVVNLVAWEDKNRDLLPDVSSDPAVSPASFSEPEERTA